MKKVIILNGPPSSGKDTLAYKLQDHYNKDYHRCNHLRFKTKLYDLVQCVYSLDNDTMLHLKLNKETPNAFLNGLSFRQALIKVSEDMIKPNFGSNYFGIHAALALKDGINIFSDGGFDSEINDMVKCIGETNIILVRLHRSGTSFAGDSRNYVYPTSTIGVDSFDFHNNYPIEESAAYLIAELEGFINK